MHVKIILFRKLKYQEGTLVQWWICWYVRVLQASSKSSLKRKLPQPHKEASWYTGGTSWQNKLTTFPRLEEAGQLVSLARIGTPPWAWSLFPALCEWTLTAMLHTMWAFQTPVYLRPGPSAFPGVAALEKVIEVLVGYSPNLPHLLLRLFWYMSLNVTTLKDGANSPCMWMRTLEFRDVE